MKSIDKCSNARGIQVIGLLCALYNAHMCTTHEYYLSPYQTQKQVVIAYVETGSLQHL
jgi:hypothetical protein